MTPIKPLAAALLCAVVLTASARAETITSAAGAKATVSSKYAAQFQALIRDLEAAGSSIKFMGGYRPGVCAQDHKHSCSMAIDLCQFRRGVVDARCRLPGRAAMSAIAKRHNLFSGGDWCNSDYGHVEAGGSTACGHSWASRGELHEAGNHRRRRVGGHGYASIGQPASGGPGSPDFR
jgi:hypothetical protein